MATKKKHQESMSLFAPSLAPAPAAPLKIEPPIVPNVRVDVRRPLRVVSPPAAPHKSEVIVESIDGGLYVVSLLRHHGTTVASVRYTRTELEQLINRATAALEVE